MLNAPINTPLFKQWIMGKFKYMVFSASVPKHLTLVLYNQIQFYKKAKVNLVY